MLYKMIEIMLAAVLLVPTFWLLNRVTFHNWKRTIHYFVFGLYLAAVYSFAGLPTLQFMRLELNLEWMPFMPMLADLKNTVLNVALFVPLGILLPFLWETYRTGKAAILFGFGMSLSIELLQIFTYRATDINDLIANTLGTVIGYGIYQLAIRLIPALGKHGTGKNEIAVVMAAVFLVMFFLQPYLASAFYAIT
ncbi:MAG: VanZ family protein [Oscillospiraceae bacterium]|nr:VanZ family protein [Oscillospiraceae bacterium]